jgi:hypothetical protein
VPLAETSHDSFAAQSSFVQQTLAHLPLRSQSFEMQTEFELQGSPALTVAFGLLGKQNLGVPFGTAYAQTLSAPNGAQSALLQHVEVQREVPLWQICGRQESLLAQLSPMCPASLSATQANVLYTVDAGGGATMYPQTLPVPQVPSPQHVSKQRPSVQSPERQSLATLQSSPPRLPVCEGIRSAAWAGTQ